MYLIKEISQKATANKEVRNNPLVRACGMMSTATTTIVAIAVGAVTTLFFYYETQRIATQRQQVKHARQLLAKWLKSDLWLHVNHQHEGMDICTLIWMLSVLVNLLAVLGEGEFNLLLGLGAGVETTLCAARYFNLVSLPRSRLIWLARGVFVLHVGLLLGLALPGYKVLEVGLRRILLTVVLMLGSFIESLEEILLQEEMLVHMARENATEAFLSHAIKQKFASVGSALEQFSLVHRTTLPPLLVESINECKLGHSMCYAASIYRKLNQGEMRPQHKIGVDNLRKQLATTPMGNLLLPKQGLSLDPNIHVEMDWELFHLVLTELARRRKRIVRVWISGDSLVKLQFHLPARSLNLVTIQLMQQLKARFTGNDVLEIDCKIYFSSPSSQPCSPLVAIYVLGNTSTAMKRGSRLQELLGESYLHALSGLKFALVDDNALIRRNFYRLLTQNLGIPPDNILCMGETLLECKHFPTTICEGGVDIAIFDQNLDFESIEDEDGTSIRGSNLALRAKRLGFTGCMILHSSDAQHSSPDANNYIFHSTVEKTASPVKFATGVAKAWLQFKRI
ncbi:hypothetical protein BASA81_003232 [Batrachochytrium salamandrivorans]|nr:hypothetical protein BASA81_003232 [Batrachochytrium salamandrivorans]